LFCCCFFKGSIEHCVVLEERCCLPWHFRAVIADIVQADAVICSADKGGAGEGTAAAEFHANPAPHEDNEEVSVGDRSIG